MTHTIREPARVVSARRQVEGGGFIVRRPFPTPSLDLVDPFLLLDEMGPADYAPYERVFEVEGPRWITGRVVALTHRDDTRPWTRVDVRTTDGRVRRWVVNGRSDAHGEPGCEVIVHALLNAHTAGADIALQVDRLGEGGRIEGFRLPA